MRKGYQQPKAILAATCTGAMLTLMTQSSLAQATLEVAPPASGYLAQLLGGLVLVIGCILLLGWMLRRIPGGIGQSQDVIRILAVRSIGTRERLMLIQVGEEQLLIGLTPAGIRHLHTLEGKVTIMPAEPHSADFAALLARFNSKEPQR